MHIHFNDQPLQCAETLTLSELLEQLDWQTLGVAVTVNQLILPREQWDNHLLHDGDQILLFQAIAGG